MRVVVADSHPAMCLGLKEMLLRTDIRVVGEAGNGEEVLRLAKDLRPDLVILGLNLTGNIDGVEACRRIKSLQVAPRVLVYTAYDFTEQVFSTLLSEADGYLHKRACRIKLLDAISHAASGEKIWPRNEGVAKSWSHKQLLPEGAELTAKEREILVLVLRGFSNPEMARKLYLSLPTVRTHMRNVLRKLGAKSRKDFLRLQDPEAANF